MPSSIGVTKPGSAELMAIVRKLRSRWLPDLARSSMTQNVYDNPDFSKQYSRMVRSFDGLAAAPEWSSLRSMLPDMRGARVLDLGCGFGWFARWARERGAHCVIGFDVSENMLERTIEMTSDSAIEYRRLDLEEIEVPERKFDLAFTSLALHYIQNLDRLFRSVYRGLVPGGWFIFSTEHPIYTASRRPEWFIQKDGHRSWPVDQYLVEGSRATDWLTKAVIKQHRTIATTVNLLIQAGFALARLDEWGPADDQIAARPEWAEHRDRPMFLLVAARK
jgi:ubiquinone/menaquinone biosynthesis C-methylase UbiE